ncbi:MAG: ribonuclease E/G [Pseudomonadota bacterium]
MKGRLAALDHLPDGRRIAALVVDGQLEDLLVDPPLQADPAQPGAIFLGKIGRPMKGLGGAMVDLGQGMTGFLRDARNSAPGTLLPVQVVSVTEPGKAPPITSRVLFKSRYAIVTPGRPGQNLSRSIKDDEVRRRLTELSDQAMAGAPDGFGLILRSAAGVANDEDVGRDIEAMVSLAVDVMAEQSGAPTLLVDAPDAHLLAWREWADPMPDQVLDKEGCFGSLDLWDIISLALRPRSDLGQGAFAYVEPTRALVAVDVNTGGDTSPAAALKANVAALRRLPRTLRLRGLAGQVVVDLAPASKRERSQLEQVMRAAIRSDGAEMSIAGWTPLGHLELQRKRDRHPTREVLRDVMPDL